MDYTSKKRSADVETDFYYSIDSKTIYIDNELGSI